MHFCETRSLYTVSISSQPRSEASSRMSGSLLCRRDPGVCQEPPIPTLHCKKLTGPSSQHIYLLVKLIITKSYSCTGRVSSMLYFVYMAASTKDAVHMQTCQPAKHLMFPPFFSSHQPKVVYMHLANVVVTGSLASLTSPIWIT